MDDRWTIRTVACGVGLIAGAEPRGCQAKPAFVEWLQASDRASPPAEARLKPGLRTNETAARITDGLVVPPLDHPGQQFAPADLLRRFAAAADKTDEDEPGTAAAERARSAVTTRIRSALQKIHRHHAAPGRYLAVSVKTGHRCGYVPDPLEPIAWSEAETSVGRDTLDSIRRAP